MAALMTGICGGVDIAHKAGIFHRDLKPENILLPESGTGPEGRGLRRRQAHQHRHGDGGTMSAVGTIVGTPAYMSPEQLRGEAVDARADVFSLGVMAYEMLTARMPYPGTSLFDIGMQQVEGKIDTSGIDPALAERIRAAIAYEKEKRPDSALAFATRAESRYFLDYSLLAISSCSSQPVRRSISATAWPI